MYGFGIKENLLFLKSTGSSSFSSYFSPWTCFLIHNNNWYLSSNSLCIATVLGALMHTFVSQRAPEIDSVVMPISQMRTLRLVFRRRSVTCVKEMVRLSKGACLERRRTRTGSQPSLYLGLSFLLAGPAPILQGPVRNKNAGSLAKKLRISRCLQ